MRGATQLARAALRLLPPRVRRVVRPRLQALRDVLAIPARLRRLETLVLESSEQIHERSRARWAAAPPNEGLTWGQPLAGDAFVEQAERHGAFTDGGTVLEVGPGYGRLPDAALRRGVPFARWIGVDLSERNVAHLRERFGGDPRFEFVNDDVETVALDGPVDAIVSSLTLKHLYPSFERALANLSPRLSGRGVVVVDLIEGSRRYFEGEHTYIRAYSREEVASIFERCGLRVEAFDFVDHDPDHRRLLVVGRRA